MSIVPAVTSPLPSTVITPPTRAGLPELSKPLSRKAYCPFKRDSLPEPHVAAMEVASVIVAEAVFVPSVTEVAVSVTVGDVGTLAGALYVTEVVVTLVSVPQVGVQTPPPCESAQVTPALAGSFEAVAVKFCVVLITTVADVGETETVMAGTVIVAEPDFVASALETAVRVTVRSLSGGVAGAVYVVGFEVGLLSVPHVGEQGVTPSVSVHATAVFDVPPTVAVNCAVPLASTCSVVGETETLIAGTVIVTEADLVLSVAEVAVRVMVRVLAGGVVGAV